MAEDKAYQQKAEQLIEKARQEGATKLDLSGMRLKEIPAAIASLTQLQWLYLDSNPLNPELAAAYEQGLDAVMAYLRAKGEQQITLNEAKLILIGEGEVGKTCLLGALRGDEWQENRPTTHGIEIKPVLVKHKASDTEITLNAWDFGGQRVYRPTHQLFFSAPGVYLVVWKPREGPQQGFVQEWITLIKHREPDAKILVVATHGGPGNRQPDIDKQGILDQFGKDTVLGFFHVNSKPNPDNNYCDGIIELKDAIANVAASLPEMGRSIPAKWQKVRETLQTHESAYLAYQDVINICRQQKINEQQAKLFITISHTLGHIIHYDYNGRALLEHIGTDIKITVRAAYPERFLSYLTEEVKWLVKDFWEGLRCNVMVACIQPCGMNKPGLGLFEVQKLIESKKRNRHEYPCNVSGCDEWQNIDQLLTNAPIASSSSPEIDPEKLYAMLADSVKDIRQDIRILDSRNQKRSQELSQGQRKILSQVDQEFASLMQMFTDEAKDGPRLFSLKPVNPGFFDRPTWMSTKFQLTLWCEHSRQPLPALNPPESSKKGVYELNLSREWLRKAAPFLNILFKTLSLVAPVAVAGTNLIMDDATYAGVKEELDLGQKSLDLVAKGGLPMLDKMSETDAPNWSEVDAIMAKGAILRELHVLLKEKDPTFGGLVRVQNKRRQFLWVHEQFINEY